MTRHYPQSYSARPHLEALEFLRSRRTHALVVAPAGFGKSHLLRTYVDRYGSDYAERVFLNGAQLSSISGLDSAVWESLRHPGSLRIDSEPHILVVVDGLDEVPPSSPALSDLASAFRNARWARLLVSSRPLGYQFLEGVHAGNDFELVTLEAWGRSAVEEFLREQGVNASPADLARILELSRGIPGLVSFISSQLRTSNLGLAQLESALDEFETAGIFLPNGKPVLHAGQVSPVFLSEIASTNEAILRRLQRTPEEMLQLPPRKFEEMVASMLERQGYSVELTPASKDGGFDIYVAKKEPLGSFLYLVECKRFIPPHKVGVQLVRSLHGVVQKTRANAGMLVTTSFFTRGAQQYANELAYTLHLHDFLALKRWLNLL